MKPLALLLALLALAPVAHAEPVETRSPAHCRTAEGSEVDLPPSVCVPSPEWVALDAEVRRLQAAEVRLGAENKDLRVAVAGQSRRILNVALWGALAGVVLGAAATAWVLR